MPTAREQVNLVGAGVRHIHVADIEKARDSDALEALALLTDAGILTVKS